MSSAEKFAQAQKLERQAQEMRREGSGDWLKEQRARPLAERLCYAAYTRCICGAGMAYDPAGLSGGYPDESKGEKSDSPFRGPFGGYWDCSDIILGKAIAKGEPGSVQHDAQLPFCFYEVKSEDQPSANGATTRPKP